MGRDEVGWEGEWEGGDVGCGRQGGAEGLRVGIAALSVLCLLMWDGVPPDMKGKGGRVSEPTRVLVLDAGYEYE